MLTRTEQLNLYKELTLNSTTENTTLGDSLIRSETQKIFSLKPWTFLRKTRTATTVSGQQSYQLPSDFKMLETVTVLSGGFQYTPREVKSKKFWDKINVQNTVTSTYPSWYMIYDRKLWFFPILSSSTATINYSYYTRVADLTQNDYTTGTITTATLGSPNIVGTGTNWNDSMAGRWIRITETSLANAGDGLWYRIASITNATNLVLENNYLGKNIVTGSASYTIGQISLLPDGFHELPVYRAVAQYWTFQVPDTGRATLYNEWADRLEKELIQQFGRDSSGIMINDTDIEFQNPNLYIQSTSN